VQSADVLVVGLGAMGSATLLQLALRGVRVIGVDRFSPPHRFGSSHGQTRITRLANGEGEVYTPVVRRSHALWRELEEHTGAELLVQCGGIVIQRHRSVSALHGAPDFLHRTLDCARSFGIAHEVLDASAIGERFPQFLLSGDERGYFEPAAGYLRPEACITAELDLAARHGAGIRRNETVLDVSGDQASVRVTTSADTYTAGHCIVCAGSWVAPFLPDSVRPYFTVYPQTLAWFALRDGATDHSPGAMPVFIRVLEHDRVLYGFPAIDSEPVIKVGTEQFERTSAPDDDAAVDSGDLQALYNDRVAPTLRDVTPKVISSVRCRYTTTPDHGFIVDQHPSIENALIVSACSGHGFKHSAALGEAVAELVVTGRSSLDLSPFSLSRFSEPASTPQSGRGVTRPDS